ncbi:hypothetical protein SDC9_167530 [bioreactor metagenome]|uniref:Uncharacterized protein n=1 Tax=bioreactor metagenome TaxID=1076179 RepID=A0A645G8A7_9ZZZZ
MWRDGLQMSDRVWFIAVRQACTRCGADVRTDPRLCMQHRALLPAIFHRGAFDKLRQLGADAIAKLIGELIFSVARILSRLIAQ